MAPATSTQWKPTTPSPTGQCVYMPRSSECDVSLIRTYQSSQKITLLETDQFALQKYISAVTSAILNERFACCFLHDAAVGRLLMGLECAELALA